MKVKRVENYFYRKHDSRVVFNERDVAYYREKGYDVVNNYSDEGYWRMSRPVQVWLDVVDENGNQHSIECKDVILSIYGMKKISEKAAERFFNEIRQGKWFLDIDHWGGIIPFSR